MRAMQNVPSWGIDRVDQRGYPLDDNFQVRGELFIIYILVFICMTTRKNMSQVTLYVGVCGGCLNGKEVPYIIQLTHSPIAFCTPS